MKQVKTKRIEVEYTDGQKIVIEPYEHEGKKGYGFNYYDNKGRQTEYEGSWNPVKISDWILEILEDDMTGYQREFDRIQMEYSS